MPKTATQIQADKPFQSLSQTIIDILNYLKG